jgi:diadenosine tetraphosphate (Ap4A) HIT family hydrolase
MAKTNIASIAGNKLDPQLSWHPIPQGDPPWFPGLFNKVDQIRLAKEVLIRDVAINKAQLAFSETLLGMMR